MGKSPNESSAVSPIQEMADLAKSIEQKVAKAVPGVDVKQRKRSPRPRRGSEKVVAAVVGLAVQHGAHMPGMTPEQAGEALARATAYDTIAALLVLAANHLSGAAIDDRGAGWSNIMGCYSILQRMSIADPKLAAALAPIIEEFAVGKRGSKQPEGNAPRKNSAPKTEAPPVESTSPTPPVP